MEPVNHQVDIRFTTKVERSQRVLEVAESFGLGLSDKEFVIYDNLEFETRAGDVVYVMGQSGSGKSLILRAMRKNFEAAGLKVAVIDEVVLEDKPLIDQIGNSTVEACELLSKAGLNDANLFIRKPSELSDGQRYRLRIAKLMQSDADVWIADEFGAVLDRVTAKVVAFSCQKFARKKGVTLAVATTHKDLKPYLNPSLVIDKRFSREITVTVSDSDEKESY